MDRTIVWWLWKFGGSSLASYDRLSRVTSLVREQLSAWFEGDGTSPHTPARYSRPIQIPSPSSPNLAENNLAVVVSAVGGVTDLLASALQKSQKCANPQLTRLNSSTPHTASQPELINRQDFIDSLESVSFKQTQAAHEFTYLLSTRPHSHIYGQQLLKVVNLHLNILEQILNESVPTTASLPETHTDSPNDYLRKGQGFEEDFFRSLNQIICILESVCLTGTFCSSQEALVLGQGEIWSVRLLELAVTSTLKQINGTNIIPLVLNARECLTIRQIGKQVDIRRNLPKINPANQSSASQLDLVEKQPSFLPSLSRSCLASSNAPLCDYTVPRSRRTPSILSMDHRDTVDYEIGAGLRETSSAEPGRKTDDDPESSAFGDAAKCAFPHYKEFPEGFFPPSGPVVVESSLPKGYIPRIDWLASYKGLSHWFEDKVTELELPRNCYQHSFLLLITGFICKTIDERPATLQRNGSDTSAVAFATLLRAEGVTIWSDVAGIYTGDPRYCPGAEPLLYLNYDEALELAGIGAKVLHPGSLLPCMHMRLPMLLKSSFRPELRGTTIALFAAVERAGTTSLLVSQGVSTSAISIAVASDQTEQVVADIVETFKHDAEDYGSHLRLSVDTECSILSVVGRGQVSFVGALAAWCAALRDSHVSIKAISQSSSELSTSFVVHKDSQQVAFEALHQVVQQQKIL